MRYSATDKTEIIRLVEQSHLPARQTLEKLGIPRSSFAGGNWWRANEIVVRHLTRQTATRYRCRDRAARY